MSFLRHHGVKGQEWGVRNGPPYPIETGMRKGLFLLFFLFNKKKSPAHLYYNLLPLTLDKM